MLVVPVSTQAATKLQLEFRRDLHDQTQIHHSFHRRQLHALCRQLFRSEESDRTGSEVLPYPDPHFQGVIGPAGGKSVASWPKEVTAKMGAPNVVLILVDDVGFSATSTFRRSHPDAELRQISSGWPSL